MVQRTFFLPQLPNPFKGQPRRVSPRLGDGGWVYDIAPPTPVVVNGRNYQIVHISVPGRLVPRTEFDRQDATDRMVTRHEDFHVTLEEVGGVGRLHYHFDEHGNVVRRGDDLSLLQSDPNLNAWEAVVSLSADFKDAIARVPQRV